MDAFVSWFNQTAPQAPGHLPALVRAGIAHLYFESPTLIALAGTMESRIDGWLQYFAKTVLEAQRNTIARISFHVAKARFLDRARGRLNARQEKVIFRVLREGPMASREASVP